jgi:hypothetical protein
MQPMNASQPARRRLTLTKETLRRLTPADLRLAAGGGMPTTHTISQTLTVVSRTSKTTAYDCTK